MIQKYCPKASFAAKVGMFINWNNNIKELWKFIQIYYLQIYKKENLFLNFIYFKFGSKDNKHNWERTKKKEAERKWLTRMKRNNK